MGTRFFELNRELTILRYRLFGIGSGVRDTRNGEAGFMVVEDWSVARNGAYCSASAFMGMLFINLESVLDEDGVDARFR